MENAGGAELGAAMLDEGPDPAEGAMRDTTRERKAVLRDNLLLVSRLSFLSLSELSDLGMVHQ